MQSDKIYQTPLFFIDLLSFYMYNEGVFILNFTVRRRPMKRRILSVITLIFVIALTIVPFMAVQSSAAEETATISFESTAQRTSFNTLQQVWENEGVTFTNDKAGSSSNVANYSNPIRLYAKSSATISVTDGSIITKIEVTCDTSSYATVLKNSVGSEASASGTKITIVPTKQSSTYTIASFTAQTRFNSLTVTYTTAESACQHENKTTETVNATCTEAGSTTVTCKDCGEEISNEVIEATGHNYVDGACTTCGELVPVANFVVPNGAEAIENKNGPDVTLPNEPTTTGSYAKDYTFVGWAMSNISEDTTTLPTVYDAGKKVTIDESTTFYAVYSYSDGEGSASTDYVLTDLADIKNSDKVVITITNSSGGVYAMANNKGTSAAPTATKVTVANGKISGDVADTLLWNIANDNGSFTIYVDGTTEKWLYCTATNNGVRVGTNTAKAFTIDATTGYLKHTGTGRYLGVYNNQDWRCYTNTTGNTANQTLGFYVLSSASAIYYTTTLETTACPHTNTTETRVESTCINKGSITVTCDDCHATVSTEVLPLAEHTPGAEATCTTPQTCTECGYEISPVIDHSYVDGFCSVCGKEEPYIPTLPEIGIGHTISATNANGLLYFDGTVSGGRFNATADESAAAIVYVEAATNAGEYLIYFFIDGTKTYIVMDDSASGCSFAETSSEATAFEWNSTANTFEVADDNNARGFGMQTTSTNNNFSAYALSNVNNSTYTWGIFTPVETCDHIYADGVVTDPTCTTVGYTTYTCTKCGYFYTDNEVPALGHTYDSVVVTTPTCTETGTTSHTCSVCLDSYEETVAANGHNIVDGVCTECGEALTDYSGRYYIATIRSSGNYWYMTNDLGTASNKRYQAVDSGLTELPGGIAEPAVGYVFVLVRNDDGTYRIYAEGVDGDNYLGWTSGNTGILVAESDAKNFTVDITEDGLYNIHFTDTKERYLSLNSTTGNNYFAFYEGTQRQDLSLIPVKEAGFSGASLNIGKDLSLRYHIELKDGETINGLSIRFTMNERSETVTSYEIDTNGKYVFSFRGIAPQCMGDSITAELLFKGGVVATIEYSVKQYAIDAFALYPQDEYPELNQLLADMLYYGAAAQNYTGYKKSDLVTDAFDSLVASTAAPDASDKNKSISSTDGDTKFTAAGVRFDYDNRIYVKFKASSLEGITVSVNGENLEIQESEDKYIAYSNGISALDFGEVLTFTLKSGDTVIQTLTYTVNSYALDKYGDEKIGDLTLALYRYGKSAIAYDETV